MVTLLNIVILAIIQGITEWLPISSSGHLVIFQELFNIQVPVSFDIGLHLGSLFALGIYFRWMIWERLQQRDFWLPSLKEKQLIFYLILSGISTGIIVLILNDLIHLIFSNLQTIGLGLFLTALFLGLSKLKNGKNTLSVMNAVLIGIAQGIAAIPGISRSGLTFSVGILSGMSRELVFTYSLLLSVPTIIGTMIFESCFSATVLQIEIMILGIMITTIVGYFSIALLKKIYDNKSGLVIFIPYCIIMGALLITFNM